jgi:hypothetical protein
MQFIKTLQYQILIPFLWIFLDSFMLSDGNRVILIQAAQSYGRIWKVFLINMEHTIPVL